MVASIEVFLSKMAFHRLALPPLALGEPGNEAKPLTQVVLCSVSRLP